MQELNDMQRAEPNECGSCQYFEPRQPGDGHGICRFRLPPWVIDRGSTKECWEVDPRTVQDTASCSLYEARNLAGDPVQFGQMRYWRAGCPSR